jgi:hypothetical protein
MKRASDNYIQLKKKVTNKEIIKIVNVLSVEWLLSPTEVCYRFINEQAQKEIKKKAELKEIMKYNK